MQPDQEICELRLTEGSENGWETSQMCSYTLFFYFFLGTYFWQTTGRVVGYVSLWSIRANVSTHILLSREGLSGTE